MHLYLKWNNKFFVFIRGYFYLLLVYRQKLSVRGITAFCLKRFYTMFYTFIIIKLIFYFFGFKCPFNFTFFSRNLLSSKNSSFFENFNPINEETDCKTQQMEILKDFIQIDIKSFNEKEKLDESLESMVKKIYLII